MSQADEHLGDIIPGVSGAEFVARRQLNHEILADAGACSDTYPLYDDPNCDIEVGAADMFEDMMTEMAECAAAKDTSGYHMSTECTVTVFERRRLEELSETVRWFKLMPSVNNPKNIACKTLWLNSAYGDITNAWKLFGGHHVFHIVDIRADWTKQYLRNYEQFKRAVFDAHARGANYKSLLYSFTNYRDIALFCREDFVSVPFMCDAVGFDGLQLLYETYTIRSITIEDGELLFECENFEQHIMERIGDLMLGKGIVFKNPELKCPRFITVPADAVIYNFTHKWKDYVHSTIA